MTLRVTVTARVPLPHDEVRLELTEGETLDRFVWVTANERAAKLTFGQRVILSARVRRGRRTLRNLRSVRFEGRW